MWVVLLLLLPFFRPFCSREKLRGIFLNGASFFTFSFSRKVLDWPDCDSQQFVRSWAGSVHCLKPAQPLHPRRWIPEAGLCPRGLLSVGPWTLGCSAAPGPLSESVVASAVAEAGASFSWEITRALLANHVTEGLNFLRFNIESLSCIFSQLLFSGFSNVSLKHLWVNLCKRGKALNTCRSFTGVRTQTESLSCLHPTVPFQNQNRNQNQSRGLLTCRQIFYFSCCWT